MGAAFACLFSNPACTPQVSHVLAALQAGNRGTQACITAASAVSGIIADLDTTIMFATAGTLNRENSETFADHRYQGQRVGHFAQLKGSGSVLLSHIFVSCGPAPGRPANSCWLCFHTPHMQMEVREQEACAHTEGQRPVCHSLAPCASTPLRHCLLSDTLLLPREGILKTAKALVEDTKVLVQNATASQEKLAQAAQSSVSTITRLAEVVKLGAASLGSEDPETQVGWSVWVNGGCL